MRSRFEQKDGTFHGDHGVALEVKEIAEDGTFEGYGSVFGNVDRGGDMILPGAFLDSLAQVPAARVKLLWMHDTWQPIGKFLDIREDQYGLLCRGQLNLKVQRGAEAYALIQDGAIDGLSIGYRTTADEIDRALGIRRILKCDLMEISVVTFPMNPAASIHRSKGQVPTKRDLEALLTRDAGLSSKQAKAFIAGGYGSITERDAEGGSESEVLTSLQELARAFRA